MDFHFYNRHMCTKQTGKQVIFVCNSPKAFLLSLLNFYVILFNFCQLPLLIFFFFFWFVYLFYQLPRDMLKSLTMTVDVSISPFSSARFCFMCSENCCVRCIHIQDSYVFLANQLFYHYIKFHFIFHSFLFSDSTLIIDTATQYSFDESLHDFAILYF